MDLPLHPLVIHIAVVFIPLAALTAIAFSFLPKFRWLLRWPLAGLAVLASVSAFVAVDTGGDLFGQLMQIRGGQMSEAAREHASRGNLLAKITYGFTVLTLLSVWTQASTSPLVSKWGERDARWGVLPTILKFVVPVISIAVIVFTVLTGHEGAESVWG